jgi:PAS domain S-box-containing protein
MGDQQPRPEQMASRPQGQRTDSVSEDHDVAGRSSEEVSRLLRDLRNRQTELELQNTEMAERSVECEAMFDSMAEAVIFADTSRRIRVINPAAARLWGYTPDELIGRTTACLYESEADFERQGEVCFHVGEPFAKHVFEMRYRRKNGSTFLAETIGTQVRDADGKAIGLLGVHRDITAQREAEETLRNEQAFTETALNTIQDLFYVFDTNGKILRWNRRVCEVTGYSDEEVAAMSPSDFFPSEDAKPVEESVETVYRDGHGSLVASVRAKDGRLMPFEFMGSSLVDSEGETIGFCGVGRSLSESEEAIAALEASETNYREVFNATNDAFFIHDMKTGRILDVNAATCRMYGVTPEEARELDVLDFSSGEPGYTQEDARRNIVEAVRKDKSVFEWHAKKKTGELFWVEVSLQRAVIGGQQRILAVVRDITERKEADAELEENLRKLSNALQIAKLGYWEYDVASNLFTFDDQFYALFRTTAEEVGGYTMTPEEYSRKFLHPDDVFIVADETRRAIETTDPGYSSQLEHRIIFADGQPGYIAVRFFIVKDEKGRTVKTYGANQDITDRKQAEEALRRAHEELETRVQDRTKELVTVNVRLRREIAERQRSEQRERELQSELAHVGRLTTMGEMASGLAHELNQPLAAIILQSEVIARLTRAGDKGVPDEVLKSIRFIVDQSHRAGDLIRRMREFVRHTAPRRVVVTISAVVDEVLPLAERDLREAGIALELEIEGRSLNILADKVQLQQVLLNLIRNAIEAMETTNVRQRRLCVRTRTREQMLEVSVRDAGCGIPPEKSDRVEELFGAFFSTKAEGLGMGLAISRSIVESHGGRIWVEPNPDRGTTFTFTVPLATEG